MLKQVLADLKDFILTYNPYFDTAFSYVEMDDETGIVHDEQPVFPSETFGNYFYLRFTNQLTPDYANPIADNSLSLGIRANVFIVACMRDADADLLVGNILSTVGRYEPINTVFGQILYHSEDVLKQELAKMKDKENITAALQRLPQDMTIVSVQVTINFPYSLLKLNCITKPCKVC